MIATLLQVVGVILVVAGAYVAFGPGGCIISAGVAAIVGGIVLELDGRA